MPIHLDGELQTQNSAAYKLEKSFKPRSFVSNHGESFSRTSLAVRKNANIEAIKGGLQ